MELKNQVAIVTGVSKGIGLQTALELLQNGCRVAGWSRSQPDISHDHFHFVRTDVGNPDSVQKAFDHTREKLGENISILINNAGLGFEALLEDTTVAQWQEMYNTNVNGIFYCTRLVLPLMKIRQEGHIINISSVAGTLGISGMAGYCGTKHAVRGISHSLMKEVRNDGIKVTCVYPGSTQTHFFDHIASTQVNEGMLDPREVAQNLIRILQTSENYLPVDVEMRPLRPKRA